MDSFLKELYQKPPLIELAKGMEEFWKEYSERREKNFAQQGYEDKGYGHCERIIANVGELLEKYCEILYRLNDETFKSGTIWTEEKFKEQFRNHLEPNLILFITAAYLHDIGMCFPGIFQALNEVLKSSSGDSAAHINKIIHDYHNYATFIVLLEMNSLALQNFEIFRIDKKIPYLENIPENFKEEDIKKLATLKKYLTEIYKKYFSEYSNPSNGGISINKEDFFIILGIICLLHQKVEPHYVLSILRKFTPDRKETVDDFNKWYAFFTRAREWTDLAPDWFPKEMKPDAIISDKKEPTKTKEPNPDGVINDQYIGPELIHSKENPERKLDLLLTSALLQYGDKTEISIARLMKTPERYTKDKKMTGLKKFWKDTQWDNKKGYVCTDMAPQVISSYARFRACRFIPLFLVKVQKNYRVKPEALDVVMHYFRFPKDKDVFPLIRYHNEKDFQDLKFLDVIKFHLPVLLSFLYFKNKRIEKNQVLEINLKRKEYPFPTIDNELKRLFPYFVKGEGAAYLQKEINSVDFENPSDDFIEKLTKQVDRFITREKKIILDFKDKISKAYEEIRKIQIKDWGGDPVKRILKKKFSDLDKEVKNLFENFIVVSIAIDKFFNGEKREKYVLPNDLEKDLANRITCFIKETEEKESGQAKNNNANTADFSSLGYEQRKKLTDFLRCLELGGILYKILNNLSFLNKSIQLKEDQKESQLKEFISQFQYLDNLEQDQKTKLDNFIKKVFSEIKNNQFNVMNEFAKIIYQKYSRRSQFYGLNEELACILCNSSSNKEMRAAVAFIQKTLDSAGNKWLEDRFPYTPQNREAITEFSQSILKPGIKNKELFFKSSGLTIPSSFELMAILNLFLQEE